MKNSCRPCSTNPPAEAISRPRRKGSWRPALWLAGGIVLTGIAGCSTIGAKPWEHDLLAQKQMQLDPYPLETASDEHIYFSKEASSGGRSFAGGGCGCN